MSEPTEKSVSAAKTKLTFKNIEKNLNPNNNNIDTKEISKSISLNFTKDDYISVETPASEKSETELVNSNSSSWSKYTGLLLAVNSSLVFSLTALIVKYLKDYDPISINLWRYQGTLLPSIPILFYHQFQYYKNKNAKETEGNSASVWQAISPLSEKKKLKMLLLLLTRSILTCNALLLHVYSLKYLEISDALVISSSTPVFVTLFAHFFLREKCGVVPIVFAIFTIFGVVVITRPPLFTGDEGFDLNAVIGAGLALGTMLLSTVSFVVLRYIRKIHYGVTTSVFGLFGTTENVILGLVLGYLTLPQGLNDWLLAAALALLTLIGQVSIIYALKCEQAGPVSLVGTCDVIFAFTWQILFLKRNPDMHSIVGAIIVLFGVIVTALRKWLGSLSDGNVYKKRFWIILK